MIGVLLSLCLSANTAGELSGSLVSLLWPGSELPSQRSEQ